MVYVKWVQGNGKRAEAGVVAPGVGSPLHPCHQEGGLMMALINWCVPMASLKLPRTLKSQWINATVRKEGCFPNFEVCFLTILCC